MNYSDGIIFIKNLYFLHQHLNQKKDDKIILKLGNVTLQIPGYKSVGDYKVLFAKNGDGKEIVFTHEDIVDKLYHATNAQNANAIIDFLIDLYRDGLLCKSQIVSGSTKELLYWLTLQEDLNYPIAKGKQGRKLPFQRYYEAVLAKLNYFEIDTIKQRTNNHKGGVPKLFEIPKGVKIPNFYEL